MKIVLKSGKDCDEQYEDEMEVFTKEGESIHRFRVHSLCDCPEDAIVGRDLIPCWQIVALMKVAHMIGKKGEELEIEELKLEE